MCMWNLTWLLALLRIRTVIRFCYKVPDMMGCMFSPILHPRLCYVNWIPYNCGINDCVMHLHQWFKIWSQIVCDHVIKAVWGPSPVISHIGFRYYILFTDQYSQFSWIYFCSHKSEVSSIFQHFKNYVENLLSCHIQTVQIDEGT
jgi:hypothetical protein